MMKSGTMFSKMQVKEQQVLHSEPSILQLSYFVILRTVDIYFPHWHEWYDDFKYDFEKKKQHVTIEQYRTLVRLDIQQRLITSGSNLTSIQLDKMTKEEEESVKHLYTKEKALIQEELDFNVGDL